MVKAVTLAFCTFTNFLLETIAPNLVSLTCPITYTTTAKKFDYDVMSANCDIIVISQIYDQFGSFCKPNSGRMVLLAFSLKVTLNLTKTENRTKKSLTQLSYHCFEQRYYYHQKCWFFSEHSEVEVLVLKGIFCEAKYAYAYVPNFRFPAILTSFKREGAGSFYSTPPSLPHPPPQHQPLKSSLRLRLSEFNQLKPIRKPWISGKI